MSLPNNVSSEATKVRINKPFSHFRINEPPGIQFVCVCSEERAASIRLNVAYV